MRPVGLDAGFSPASEKPSIKGLRSTMSRMGATAALAAPKAASGGAIWPSAMEPITMEKKTAMTDPPEMHE
jgi:hypothetical protein